MKLRLLNMFSAQVLINEVCSHIQTLGHQSELPVHIDDPLEEESPAGVFDLGLHLLKVVSGHHHIDLLSPQSFVDGLGEFDYALRVIELFGVLLRHLLLFGLFVLFDATSKQLGNAHLVVHRWVLLLGGGVQLLVLGRDLGHLDVDHFNLLSGLHLRDFCGPDWFTRNFLSAESKRILLIKFARKYLLCWELPWIFLLWLVQILRFALLSKSLGGHVHA